RLQRHPPSPPFPYTTLFRSVRAVRRPEGGRRGDRGERREARRPGRHRWCAGLRDRSPHDEGGIGGGPVTLSAGLLLADRYRLDRSEEHTSELQSRENLVCRL